MNDLRRRLRSGLSPSPARRAGFTMIEILVTIAIMAGLTVVLLVGANRMLADRARAPDEVFWAVVAEARKQALTRECEVWLSFDNDEKQFRAVTAEGWKSFPLPAGMDFRLEFLGTTKGERTIMIAGQLLEANVLKGVRFFDDGTCSPFRAQLQLPGRPAEVFEVDPWTCAPVLHGEAGP